MELQYHSTNRDPISWASLRFPSREPNDTTQGYREWQGQRMSGLPDQMENPTLCRSTAGLAGDNSPFSESEECQSSRFKHLVIPKPNRAYGQYTGQDSLYRESPYWDTQRSSLRQDKNRITPASLYLTQDLNKLDGMSYKNDLSLNNSYKHPPHKRMDSEPSPPRNNYKRAADSVGRDEGNATSAFKVFKRNDNNHQFSRIKERNKNLPPPPPLVKANGKIDKISKPETKSMEEIIVIRDSPPPQARLEKCQSECRKDRLRASRIETISPETLHHSRPISSARVHTMEYRSPMGENYKPRDDRERMGLMQSYHCHHYGNMAYMPKGLPQFPNLRNDRSCNSKSIPFVNPSVQQECNINATQNAMRSHCEPHTGIQCHPDYHNSYSPNKKTSGSHKNKHSRGHKVLDSSFPSSNASSRNLYDTHEAALHAWRMQAQLTESRSDSRINDTAYFSDVLRNNSKKVSSNLVDSRSLIKKEVSPFREPRQFKQHRSQTPVVKDNVIRSQINRMEYPSFHEKSEYPCQKSKELPFRYINHKMSQLSKTDQEKLSKFLAIHCQAKNLRHPFMFTQPPSRVPEMFEYHDIQKLLVSQSAGVQSPVTQKSKYEQNQETLRSMLMSSSSQGKGSAVLTNAMRNEVVVPPGLTNSDLISPSKGHLSSQLSYSSPSKGYCYSSSGNMETRENPAVMSRVTCSSSLPNGDLLSLSNNGKASQDKKIREMPSKTNASRSPSSLDSYKQLLKETEKLKAISSQPTSRVVSTSTDAQKIQKNNVELFQSPPQSRRLSYPLENNRSIENRSQENSSASQQRTKSEGDQKTHCGTDASPLLEKSRKDESTLQACGGYAFDHDSLPIIVAVHSIVVKNESSLKGSESSQEDNTQGEMSKEDTGITSSHCVVDPKSTSKIEPTRYQRPILPKPDTQASISERMRDQMVPPSSSSSSITSSSLRPILPSSSSSSSSSLQSLLPSSSSSSKSSSSLSTSLLPCPPSSSSSLTSQSLPPLLPSSSSSSISFSSSSVSPSSPATEAEIEQPVNSVCTISSITSYCNDDKQISSQAPSSVSTDNHSSNDNEFILKEEADHSKQADDTMNLTNTDSTASVSTDTSSNGSVHLSNKSAEEVESKGNTSKLIVHRRNSVEELCNKIVETRERITKEEIDWKKKLLRRLEFVLIKKLRRAEKETGEKASIDLPPEKNAKGKEEHAQKKAKKRSKSCSDDTSSKSEQEGKQIKEKTEETTKKSSNKTNEAHNASKQKKRYHSKYDITEPSDGNVDEKEKANSKITSRKESEDSITMYQEEIHADMSEEVLSSKDEMLISSVNDNKTVEQCNDINDLFSSLSPAAEDDGFADFSCSDLVIAE